MPTPAKPRANKFADLHRDITALRNEVRQLGVELHELTLGSLREQPPPRRWTERILRLEPLCSLLLAFGGGALLAWVSQHKGMPRWLQSTRRPLALLRQSTRH
jgi:hypothetical protein